MQSKVKLTNMGRLHSTKHKRPINEAPVLRQRATKLASRRASDRKHRYDRLDRAIGM